MSHKNKSLFLFPLSLSFSLSCISLTYFASPPHTHTPDDEGNEMTRPLGLVVARGTLLVVVSPVDGSEVIANPFVQEED